MKRLFLVLVSLVFLVFNAQGEATGGTYWVSKSGSDANACFDSATEPTLATQSRLTIAAGLSCLSASDTLKIKVGTYVESINNPLPSGTSDASHTILEGVTGETVTLQCSGCNEVINFNTARSNITVRNLVLDCVNGNGTSCRGFNTSSTANITNLLVEDVRVTNYRNDGFVIGDTSSNVTLRRLKVDTALSADTSPSSALYFRGFNSIIEYSEFGPNIIDGLSMRSTLGGSVGNTLRYNYWHDGSSGDSGSRMLNISQGSAANPHKFYNNVIDTHNRHGVRFDAGDGTQFYNNTIYNMGQTCVIVDTGINNVEIINNVINTCGTNISDSGTGTVKTTNACSSGAGCSVTASPGMINAASGNFSPDNGSPLINAGTQITNFSSGRFVGSQPDIGAFEPCIRLSASVEDGDASNYRIVFSCPSQSVRNNVGLQGGAFTQFALRDDTGGTPVNKTESSLTIVGTPRVDIAVSDGPFGSGTAIGDAYTKGSLTGNMGIGCGPNDGACLHAYVLTYAEQAGINNVSQTAAVFEAVHYRCLTIHSTSAPAAADWRRVEDSTLDCNMRAGGVAAIAVAITSDIVATRSFEWHANRNGGAYAAMSNTATSTTLAFLGTSYGTLGDGESIASTILTDPHTDYVAGKIIGQQSSSPTVTFNATSTTNAILLVKSDAATAVGDRFCIQPAQNGQTVSSVTQTKTPCITITDPAASY